MVNPYTNYKMFLKYEILDIDAICEAVEKRSDLEKRKIKAERTLTQDLRDSMKIRDGKFTMGTLFKSDGAKREALSRLEKKCKTGNDEVESFLKLTHIVTLQLNQGAIQYFKSQKLSQYYKAVNLMAKWESHNAEKQVNLFEQISGINRSIIDADLQKWQEADEGE
jgi:hypothetical protein